MNLIREIQEYVSNHATPIFGAPSATIASTPVKYHADYLITHGFWKFAWSEWIQLGSFAFVMFLFVTAIIKVIKKDGKK